MVNTCTNLMNELTNFSLPKDKAPFLLYIAGLFDGDGSFHIHRKNKDLTFSLGASITLQERHVLEDVQKYLGGKISEDTRESPGFPVYRLRWHGGNAAKVAYILTNFLKAKRSQALIMSLFGTYRMDRKGKRDSVEILTENKLYELMKFCNKGRDKTTHNNEYVVSVLTSICSKDTALNNALETWSGILQLDQSYYTQNV